MDNNIMSLLSHTSLQGELRRTTSAPAGPRYSSSIHTISSAQASTLTQCTGNPFTTTSGSLPSNLSSPTSKPLATNSPTTLLTHH